LDVNAFTTIGTVSAPAQQLQAAVDDSAIQRHRARRAKKRITQPDVRVTPPSNGLCCIIEVPFSVIGGFTTCSSKVPFPPQLETNPVKPITNWPNTGR
jgi:hypothetical protein